MLTKNYTFDHYLKGNPYSHVYSVVKRIMAYGSIYYFYYY